MSLATKKPLILVVDDDPGLLRLVSRSLEVAGYQVVTAEEGTTALQLVETERPNLVLLDVILPGLDGFQVCQRIRELADIPIIMLSIRDQVEDITNGLNNGADDYLPKPFSDTELLARTKAVLRRTQFPEWMSQTVLTWGKLSINFAQRTVMVDEKEVKLPPTEYRILTLLTCNAGRVLTHDQLLEKVWGWEYRGAKHLLQVAISRLRQQIEDDARNPKYILTRVGIGYVFADSAHAQ